MSGKILRTVISCPACGFRTTERMALIGNPRSYTCPACGKTSTITDEQCCIFCAWARHPCPARQQDQA